ncbi:glycosyltransferase [Alkalihalobacillus sp. TS-13]|uniref:glycosyltransferase n=1 Tax=Alkalihalobacillus sp. TS-13 TaxID=2842455 RepID=UPI001C869231|nr:glycosyltransferase [Alkalihalobacillus sp. TS-13]
MKLNLLFIINSFSIAGAEKLVYALSKNIDKNLFNIYICSIGLSKNENENNLRKELEEKHGIKTFCLEKKKNKNRLNAIIKLRKFIKNNKIDIVHSHCPSPDFYGLISSLGLIKARFTTIHSTSGYSKNRMKIFSIFFTNIVCISDMVKSYSLNVLKLSEKKMVVIKNGIDLTPFLKEKKIVREKNNNKIKIISVGRVVNAKGYEYLINSLEKLKDINKNIHLTIIGETSADKNLYHNLLNLIKNKGLSDNVEFLGVRDDVPKLLLSSDIFVSSSIVEGFALATIEAAAAGLPIVATDVGSIRELIDKDSGIVVNSRDTVALSNGILKLIQKPIWARLLGENVKKISINLFSIKSTVISHEALYKSKIR